MNIVYECVECIASFIEIFLLYRIYNVLLVTYGRGEGKRKKLYLPLGQLSLFFSVIGWHYFLILLCCLQYYMLLFQRCISIR